LQLLDSLPGGDMRVVFDVCSSSGERRYAAEVGKGVTFSLSLARTVALHDVEILFFEYNSDRVLYQAPMHWTTHRHGRDCFSVSFDEIPLSFGLYHVLVKGKTPEGVCYVETSVDQHGWLVRYVPCQKTKPFLIYQRSYPRSAWIEGGIIYHVFVDRFCRGEETPLADGAILNSDWDNGIPQYPEYPGAPLANNMFFGGNLSGIIQKLPYLSSLGVTCLYLSPICKAASNHKYDTGNYMEIDPSFGDDATFKALVNEAHQLGIRVILDGVFNHTGDDSLYFNRYGHYASLGAYQSKDSPYANWYCFKEFPDQYECWWNISILPKLNLWNPEVRNYFLSKEGVIAHFAELGADGFRLDVADELDDGFISDIKYRLSTFPGERILYGEVWEDASSKEAYNQLKQYYWGKELDGVMNYPLRTGLIRFCKYGEVGPLRYAVETVMRNAPKEVADVLMNFLGTHDTERILSMLSDASFEGMSNDEIAYFRLTSAQRAIAKKRLELAYICLATLPGVTTVYYGDEVGMEGYKDPFNRLPYPWKEGDAPLRAFVKELFGVRRRHDVYKQGEMLLHRLTEEQFVFSRSDEEHHYLTVINRGDTPLILTSDTVMDELFPNDKTGQNIKILPVSGAIIKVKKTSLCYLYSATSEKCMGE